MIARLIKVMIHTPIQHSPILTIIITVIQIIITLNKVIPNLILILISLIHKALIINDKRQNDWNFSFNILKYIVYTKL